MAELLTAADIDLLRADTPGCRGELVHLDHAGSSLPPRSVLDAQVAHLELEADIGGYLAGDRAAEATERVYESIARSIGARRQEIARAEHATAAWSAAFWSVPMRAGQRIITHDHDYGGNAVAILHAAATRGLTVERVSNDAAGQIDLGALATALERPDDVALVSLSWIPTNGGLINPAAAVGGLTRAAGVPFLLDACQAVGQLVIDVEAIGCDFLTGTGRKYLRGPRGTGFLYVNEAMLERITPSQPDHYGAAWTALDEYEFVPGAKRFENFEFSHANWLGLGAAVDLANSVGLDRIQATVSERARQLRTLLTAIGLTVHDEGFARCGIVTASHPSIDANVLRDRLRERSINSTVTFTGSSRADVERRDLPPMLRLSVHYTTTPDEIDRTIDELTRLCSA